MLRMNQLVLASMALALSACAVKVEVPDVKLPEIKLMSCSAALAPETGGFAISGESTPVNVIAKDGTAPYQIVDTALTFDASTVLARTYTNDTNAPILVVDTVTVKDAIGLVSQCNFLVSVNPAGVVPPSNLACNMVASPSNALVDQNVTMTATASGGTAPYTFSQYTPGTGGIVVSPLVFAGSQANATAKYVSSGLRTASMVLNDNAAHQIVCSTQVNVAAAASVVMVASPATSVIAGSTITLTATPNGFSTAPTYTFTTARGGVSITWSGNVAQVTSATTQSAFDVVVTATAGSQVAQHTLSLSFVAPASLACNITHPAGVLYVADAVPFTVTATNGTPLEITFFSTHSDGVVQSQTNSSRTVKYSVPGIKTVFMTAKAAGGSALCNNGAALSDTVEIAANPVAPLTCSGSTSLNPSYQYEWFFASAAISGGQGAKWVETLELKRNGSLFTTYDGYWVDADTAGLKIPFSGTYEVKFNLKDAYGHTGSCTTTHFVW